MAINTLLCPIILHKRVISFSLICQSQEFISKCIWCIYYFVISWIYLRIAYQHNIYFFIFLRRKIMTYKFVEHYFVLNGCSTQRSPTRVQNTWFKNRAGSTSYFRFLVNHVQNWAWQMINWLVHLTLWMTSHPSMLCLSSHMVFTSFVVHHTYIYIPILIYSRK